MILGFDIGNTNTVMGIYGDDEVSPSGMYRFRTVRDATSDEMGIMVGAFLESYRRKAKAAGNVSGIAFSSVVPEVNRLYHALAKDYFSLTSFEITCRCNLSIKIHYDTPSQLGVDRIVNAEAAYREYGKNCLIVDIGTATTFCVLRENGLYDGGLIGPGIGVTIDALAARTSLLRKIPFEKPASIVATNTADALKSGFFYGWLSMVEGIIEKIEKQYNIGFLPILTGGYAAILGNALARKHVVDPLLTLKGIKYLYNLNKTAE